jgi:hypothetical protein
MNSQRTHVAKKRKAKQPEQPQPTGPTIVWSPVAKRGDVRKWRLHACGCARRKLPKRITRRWLAALELAERYADGDATRKELEAERDAYRTARRRPPGDFSLALDADDSLTHAWRAYVINQKREYAPDDPDYELVRGRFHVLEDLIGPDPLPAFDPAWRTSTVVALAKCMYEGRDFSALPILADALQDAGCEDTTILDHCRDPKQIHFRGCWVIDLVLRKAKPRGSKKGSTKRGAKRKPRGRV